MRKAVLIIAYVTFSITSESFASWLVLNREGSKYYHQHVTLWLSSVYTTGSNFKSNALRISKSGYQVWTGVDMAIARSVAISAFALYVDSGKFVRNGGGFQVQWSKNIFNNVEIVIFPGVVHSGGEDSLFLGSEARLRNKNWYLSGRMVIEKYFGGNHDRIDLNITAESGYFFSKNLSGGVKYLVQDLEDLWETAEKEGGMSQVVTAVMEFRYSNLALRIEPGYAYSGNHAFTLSGRISIGF